MTTFDDIKKANESIQTTDIKGKAYAEVNQRIKAFRMVHPNGSIVSEILSLENGVCTMKTTVTGDGGELLAVGHAQEKEASSFINKTSFIENCETSAVGRALGMCGFGIDTSVASFEEVQNAINNQSNADCKDVPFTMQGNDADGAFKPYCVDCGAEISVKVHDFAVKKFKKPLCMNCQKNYG